MKRKEQVLQIPKLSIKSSFLVLVSLIAGGILFPYLLTTIGMSFRLGIMTTLPISLAFSLVYSHYILETKQGYCKRFMVMLIVTTIFLEVMAYFWIVRGFIF